MKLYGSELSDYMLDETMLYLTMTLDLEAYYDYQVFGPSKRTLTYIADGWKDLKILHFNTEWTRIQNYLKYIKKYGKRFTSLGFTSFKEPLQPHFVDYFVPVFKAHAPNLRSLKIDLEFPNHADDGLFPNDLLTLCEQCPWIQRIEYRVSLVTYFMNSRPSSSMNSQEVSRDLVAEGPLASQVESLSLQELNGSPGEQDKKQFQRIVQDLQKSFSESSVEFHLEIVEI